MKILIAILLLAASAIAAAEPIDGAFGQLLGAPHDLTPFTNCQSPQGPCRFFEPDPPSPYFNEYVLFLTPTTGAVYEIIAEQAMEAQRCHATHAILRQILTEKYGQAETDRPAQLRIVQGQRRITVLCEKSRLQISYRDSGLAQLAKEEKIRLQTQDGTIDPAGL